jgi:NADPH:quinone reductase-like Zn-dependent oxidoreductase
VLAALALRAAPEDPLSALAVQEHPEPVPPPGWELVRVRAASLNHHDLWTLRGVGVQRLPIVLGCDGAGVCADGREVVIHSVVGDASVNGDETLDPDGSLLSERYDGTLAQLVAVPSRNLVPKPPELTWEEAACVPTAWLTAYRMILRSGARPGDLILVQGAGGGVATAAIALGRAVGLTVYATSRDPAKRERALALGAAVAVGPGERLPERVHAVIETVGAATWDHSLKSLRGGGTVVVSGATSGHLPPTDLRRVFFRQLRIVGSTMGTRSELEALLRLLVSTGVRPTIAEVVPLSGVRQGFERLSTGQVFGKIVVSPGG